MAEWALLPTTGTKFQLPVFLAPFDKDDLVEAFRRRDAGSVNVELPISHIWITGMSGFGSYPSAVQFVPLPDRIQAWISDVEQQCLSGVNIPNLNRSRGGTAIIPALNANVIGARPYINRFALNGRNKNVTTLTRKYGPLGADSLLPITVDYLPGMWYRDDFVPDVKGTPWKKGSWYDSDYARNTNEMSANEYVTYDAFRPISSSSSFNAYPADIYPYETGGQSKVARVHEYDISTWGDLPVTPTSRWKYTWLNNIYPFPPPNPENLNPERQAQFFGEVTGYTSPGLTNWMAQNTAVGLPSIHVRTSDGYLMKFGIAVFSGERVGYNLAAAGAILRWTAGKKLENWDPYANGACEGRLMARYNPRSGTGAVGIYALNANTLENFYEDLWTTDFGEWVAALFGGSGADALLGLKWYFGIKDEVDFRYDVRKVKVGTNQVGDFSALVPREEVVEYNCGNVVVPSMFGDHRDYTECEYRIWIPFVGMVDLSPHDVVGKTIALAYYVNLVDGTAIAQLQNCADCTDGIIFGTACTWAVDIPLRVEPQKDAAMIAVQSGVSAVSGAIGGASAGVAGAVVGAAGGLIGGLAQGAGTGIRYGVGSTTPNTNLMSDFRPKVFVYHPDDENDSGFPAAIGLPTGKTFTVGSAKGFLAVSEVQNTNVLPARHADEIVNALKSGVYLS